MPEIERNENLVSDVGTHSSSDGLLFGRYEVGRLLGCGAFAKVYHARDGQCGGRSVAIKVINKKKLLASNAGLAANIKREIAIMKRLRHPNIVRLLDVAATRARIYFVMEFVKGGELFAKVAKGRFAEDLARRHFRQLVSAVGYCHSRGVFHRDLKPENLLLDEHGNLKVSDFGLSAVAAEQLRADGLLHTLCGTPAYVAPEILAKRGYDGARVDVWSCGVVLFVLTAGYLPFNDPNLMAMYKKIYKGEFRCPKWMSPELKRFLSRLLDVNPDTRITIDEILRDPWFNKGGYEQKEIDFYGEEEAEKLDEDKPFGDLNAFDIISFSSGLDLSGLFVPSRDPAEDGARLVAEEAPESLVGKLEAFAEAENLRLKRRRDFGVELEGRSGDLAIAVDVYRLAEGLVVVEAKRRGGDAAVFDEVWRNKLRPLLGGSREGSEASCSSSPRSVSDA